MGPDQNSGQLCFRREHSQYEIFSLSFFAPHPKRVTSNKPKRQGKRWERVGCKMEQRRVVLRKCIYKRKAACVLWSFADDMSRRPSMVNKAHKHCHGLFKPKPPRQTGTTKTYMDKGCQINPTQLSYFIKFWKKKEHFSEADTQ
jgi:hypothetical protein